MLKIILSNGEEINVFDGSTLFDIHVNPLQYNEMWDKLTDENLKVLKLTDENNNIMDQLANLIINNESSIKENGEIVCHFYLREKNREELLEEKIQILEEILGIHDGAIGDLAEAVSGLAEEGGIS